MLPPREMPGSPGAWRRLDRRLPWRVVVVIPALGLGVPSSGGSEWALGMAAYSELQERDFAAEADGYTATRQQREVGTGSFDAVAPVISTRETSTLPVGESTEVRELRLPDHARTSASCTARMIFWIQMPSFAA